MPLAVALLETSHAPVYQAIAVRASGLTRLGLRTERIARELGVDGKTVRRALQWLDRSMI